jgi:hypothetical protein
MYPHFIHLHVDQNSAGDGEDAQWLPQRGMDFGEGDYRATSSKQGGGYNDSYGSSSSFGTDSYSYGSDSNSYGAR